MYEALVEEHEEKLQWWSLWQEYVVCCQELHNFEVNYLLGKIEEKDPKAIEWLDENHLYVWSRSKFGEDCKVDYINNNLLNLLIVGCKKLRTFRL